MTSLLIGSLFQLIKAIYSNPIRMKPLLVRIIATNSNFLNLIRKSKFLLKQNQQESQIQIATKMSK